MICETDFLIHPKGVLFLRSHYKLFRSILKKKMKANIREEKEEAEEKEEEEAE